MYYTEQHIVLLKSSFFRLWIFLFYSLLTWSHSSAQQLQFFRLDKAHTNISSQGSISDGSILKDSSGFIWIASFDGLNRWNGYEMKIFRPDRKDSTSIYAADLATMAIDKYGIMWIGSWSQGLMRYYPDKEVFDYILPGPDRHQSPDSRIQTLRSDAKGQLWVGTGHKGLHRYDFTTETFIPYPIAGAGDDTSIQRSIGGFDHPIAFLTSTGLFFPEIVGGDNFHILQDVPQTIEYGPNGNIWMGYEKRKGVSIYNPKEKTTTTLPVLSGESIFKIHFDGNTTMWLAGTTRLYEHDVHTSKTKEHAFSEDNQYAMQPDVIREILTASDGSLWYTALSLGGGYAMTNDTFITQPSVDDLLDDLGDIKGSQVSNFVIRKDNYQAVLGLSSTIPEFESIQRQWIHQIVSPVFWDTEGSFWFHDYETIRTWRRKASGEVAQVNLDPLSLIFIFDEDDQKRIWTNAKLAYYDLKADVWQYPNKLLQAKGLDTIQSTLNTHLSILENGSVALATADQGVYIYNPGDTTLYQIEAQPFTAGKLSSKRIDHLYQQSSTGKLYMSTKSNINVWDPRDSSITYIGKSEGISRKYLCIAEDENNDLWAANARGIFHISDDSLIANYSTEHLGRYDMNAGSFRGKSGVVYHNHRLGPYGIKPEEVKQISPPNDVIISELFINRKEVHPIVNQDILTTSISKHPEIELDYRNNNIGFEMGCLNGRLKRVTFYYQLKGFADDWISLGDENVIHFTNLDPGSYTLRLKALSAEGKWSKNITEQVFVIRPPWYATWWAYLLYVLSLSSILFGIYRYRINQLLRYQKLRTRISSDLHDDVGTLLSSLAWQTDLLSMTAGAELRQKFDKVSSLSRTAMERMRDTVWAIDSSRDDILSLVERMTDFLADHFENRKMAFRFEHENFSTKHNLAPDIRQNMYLIFKEAVVNAIKHSNGDLLTVSLRKKAKGLVMEVHDNGTVNPDTIKTSGLGLKSMQTRAKKIEAKLYLTWEDGCKIKLVV